MKNSPHVSFNRFDHYFTLNSDETSFLCNYGDLKVLDIKDKTCQYKFFSDSRFSITVLWVGNSAGVNGPVTFLSKGTNMKPRLRVNNFLNRYVFPEGSCVNQKYREI